MPWMNVTAEAPALNWPTNDNSSLAASRTTTKPTGGAGLSTAVLTRIVGVTIGPSSAAAELTFWNHDADTAPVAIRTINAVGTLGTNLSGNTNQIEFTIKGGFSCNVATGTVNVFVNYEYSVIKP